MVNARERIQAWQAQIQTSYQIIKEQGMLEHRLYREHRIDRRELRLLPQKKMHYQIQIYLKHK